MSAFDGYPFRTYDGTEANKIGFDIGANKQIPNDLKLAIAETFSGHFTWYNKITPDKESHNETVLVFANAADCDAFIKNIKHVDAKYPFKDHITAQGKEVRFDIGANGQTPQDLRLEIIAIFSGGFRWYDNIKTHNETVLLFTDKVDCEKFIESIESRGATRQKINSPQHTSEPAGVR
jgi:hypothetical protein